MKSARYWIDRLCLERHPEGGWYRREYTSGAKASDHRFLMTSIYYLLEGNDFSALHRLNSEEQWHFYTGSPITVHEINSTGEYACTTLGDDAFQHTVSADTWFGATVSGDYALAGCTVVPGFDFSDFALGSRDDLLAAFPQHAALITRLTR